MSIFSEIEQTGQKIATFLENLATGAKKLQLVYSTLSGPVLAAVAAVFYDVVKGYVSAQSTVSAAASGNIPLTFQLSETTLGLVSQVVSDAKAGEKTVLADFEALNIKL